MDKALFIALTLIILVLAMKVLAREEYSDEELGIYIDGIEFVYHEKRVIGAIIREGVLPFEEQGGKKAYWICGKHLRTLAKTPPSQNERPSQ